ncbi:ABC transporter permease [Minwuia sp.]|uniref:ABC transporter permease n=1 Tax=Minwuia sp. TaxID=2493630 RepID=UPI003A8D51AC
MNGLSKRLNRSGEGITLAVLLCVGFVLLGLPLGLLTVIGIAPEGALTLGPLAEALDSRSVQRALVNSIDSSLFSALFATLAGGALALLIGLTDVRNKGPYVFLILLPMMIPPHVTAIAWIQALGPASPLLQWLGIAPEVGSTHPLYSREGVIALLSLQHSPIAFLVVRAALRNLPGELSDAARVFGARPGRMMGRVVLPLLLPNLIAAFALSFVSAMGNFGIPALLGIPARYTTMPVLIWRRLSSYGPDVLTNVAIIAVIIGMVAVLAVAIQMILQRRAEAALVGLPQRPLALRLGPARLPVEIGMSLLIAAVLVLPVLSLLATALVPTYGVRLSMDTVTLKNFSEILFSQTVTLRAFANSTLIAGIAAVLLGFFAIGLGYFMTRRKGSFASRSTRSLSTLADIAYAVPGLVISIACILAFIRPLPVIGVTFYNTLWIILFAYLIAFLSIALKPVAATYQQMDSSLDDAARVSGARFIRRMARVFLPMAAPAAASGALLVFLTAYNEVTVSALLWSTGNETIGTTIFNYEDGGYTTLAAAMSAVTVVATVVLMLLLDRAGRHAPAGIVPWRD